MSKRPDPPRRSHEARQHVDNGARSLFVSCWNCHHRAELSADHWPDDAPVPMFGRACTRCGIIGADARPNWKEQPAMALTPNRFGRWCLDECTRAILVAHGFSIGMLAEL